MNDYIPHPIDNTNIKLNDELVEVLEKVARNTHEVWAEGRINEGWVYGEVMSRENKTHPCLIPYEELPESEKEYDRRTSTQVVKTLMALGYKVEKSGPCI